MTAECCAPIATPPAARPRPAHLLARLFAWIDVASQRRRLAELDERMLRDIGISREAARAEAARPFWDLPG
ncbi:MAG: DUF1127 domain-containing protein [Alphaproteobacteria bacterium]|nr:MAG: DUF1127 domain-containing protein [Alphaproteobacteria bacterium]